MLSPLMFLVLLNVGGAPAADTVVVCPPAYRKALEPWLQYRAAQGREIALIQDGLSRDMIRRQIQEVAKGGRLRFIVLVGDTEPNRLDDAAAPQRCVPTCYTKAQVNVAWGSEPLIATDNDYADLDGDQAPDVAIGRLSADVPQQVSAIVKKILAYEQSNDFGRWRRQVNVVAGPGDFGVVVDSIVESATRFLLTRGIPETYRLGVTYGNWRSPYCPDPRLLHAATLESLNSGAWLWIYAGHGLPLWLPGLKTPQGWTAALTVQDEPMLRARQGSPIAVIMACYAGRYDGQTDCLAETMLRAPGGPVAVLAGSRVTMPYGMGLLSCELIDQCFRHRAGTIGEAVLAAKRCMVKEPSGDPDLRAVLDTLAVAFSAGREKIAIERAEHVAMMNLLGDPLLTLRYGQTLELKPSSAVAGQPLVVRTVTPLAGHCYIELVPPPTKLGGSVPGRSSFPTDPEQMAAMQKEYLRANEDRVAVGEAAVREGELQLTLALPPDLRGKHLLRVFVQGANDFAAGAVPIDVHSVKNTKEPEWVAERNASGSGSR